MPKILVFRLSSLGDVVLATAALSALPAGARVDWVTTPEYAPLLRGHARIHRIYEFDRRVGLRGWLELCAKLRNENYDHILDLHQSLRTCVARIAVRAKDWRTIEKQRARLIGYFIFKRWWPKKLRPKPMTVRFGEVVARAFGTNSLAAPDLRHLIGPAVAGIPTEKYFCVMPSSKWPGKEWDFRRYRELLRDAKQLPVILGTPKDEASTRLVDALASEGVRHVSGIGRWSLRETASVLAGAVGYLGSDTGLGHLAEAVGIPAWVIFGPTKPDMGFGPWRPESRAMGSELWCRPCGKDGRFCHRVIRRHLCLTGLDTDSVRRALPSL